MDGEWKGWPAVPPIKPMAREWEKNKGQKAEEVEGGGQASGWGAVGVQMREGRCTAMRERKRGKKCDKDGKARNWGREENRSAAVIYASCIIFYSASSPAPTPLSPRGSPFLLNIRLSHQGVLLLTVAPRNRPWPHQPVIKILPWCDCSTRQMEDWT